MSNLRNLTEPELDPDECVDAQGVVRPEHDFKENECRRCYAEVMPEETEE